MPRRPVRHERAGSPRSEPCARDRAVLRRSSCWRCLSRRPRRADPARSCTSRSSRRRTASTRRRQATSTRSTSTARSSTRSTVRPPRAPVQGRAQHRRGAAGDFRRRPDVDDQDQAGHLLRRRSGVQGQEARARRRRLRLFVQAPDRPEDALANAQILDDRLVGAKDAIAAGEEVRRVRLRRALRRAAGDRPLHAAAEAHLSRLRPARRPHVVGHRGGRARSGRGLRRRERLGDGQPGGHRAVPAQGMAARARRSCSRRTRRSATSAIPTARSPDDRALERQCAARRFRPIGRVEISIIEESNPRLLAFEKGELDYLDRPDGPRAESSWTATSSSPSSPTGA